jgi:sec-independent protein translocase protein TatA
MFGLGFGELVVILLVLVLLFGASKLPQLGSGLGEGIRTFRKAFREVQDDAPERKEPPEKQDPTEPPKPK